MLKSKNNLNKVFLGDAWYIFVADYLTQEQSVAYFTQFTQELNWQSGEIKLFGKTHAIPRLEAFYAENQQAYSYSGKKLPVNPFTSELKTLKLRLENDFGLEFNSVLANFYRDGKDSNGWHADDEKELGKNPHIASVSFGASRRFNLKHKTNNQKISFWLNSGSLLLMGGDLQHQWKHQLPKMMRCVEPRINLTFRKIFE